MQTGRSVWEQALILFRLNTGKQNLSLHLSVFISPLNGDQIFWVLLVRSFRFEYVLEQNLFLTMAGKALIFSPSLFLLVLGEVQLQGVKL